ncbi:Bacterial extracellular solute-binding protein [compost metagenome]
MKRFILSLVCLIVIAVISGCSGTEGTNNASHDGVIEGKIVFLTDRTDLIDTLFKDYVGKFNEKYPEVKVEVMAFDDYDGLMNVRLSSTEYGDVLLIPRQLSFRDLPDFFEPLGPTDELRKSYYNIDDSSFDGQTYGIPTAFNVAGIVYNKDVLKKAGVESISIKPSSFLDAMRKIKQNTDATPYVTNYLNWTLNRWELHAISYSEQSDYYHVQMPSRDDPFSKGTPHYEIYKLLYDLAHEGLIEADPLTDQSGMQGLAQGTVGAMHLDTGALSQIRLMTDRPESIGFIPFTLSTDAGEVPLTINNSAIGINQYSHNKDAARAWLDWFINESGYSEYNHEISPVIGDPLPDTLSDFQNYDFSMGKPEMDSTMQDKTVEEINHDGMVGLWLPDVKQEIILSGIGSVDKSFEEIIEELNEKWKSGRID